MQKLSVIILRLLLLTPLLFIFTTHAQETKQKAASTKVVTETRQADPFFKIQVSGGFLLNIRQAPKQTIRLKGNAEDLAKIVLKVENNQLNLSSETLRVLSQAPTVTITLPQLTTIQSTGANKIDVRGLNNDQFDLKTSGSASVTLQGSTKQLTIQTSGSAKVNAKGLRSRVTDVSVTGSGHVIVNPQQSLSAKIKGAGQIEYARKPKTIDEEVFGAGRIQPLKQ